VSVVLSVAASLLQAVKKTAQVKIANNRFIGFNFILKKGNPNFHVWIAPHHRLLLIKKASKHKDGQ
jgi:hypothetical protein